MAKKVAAEVTKELPTETKAAVPVMPVAIPCGVCKTSGLVYPDGGKPIKCGHCNGHGAFAVDLMVIPRRVTT